MPAKKRTARQRANKENAQKKRTGGSFWIYILVAVICIAAAGIAYFYLANNTGEEQDDTVDENPLVIIDTSMGTITVELYEDKVPDTCENFIQLASDGFYDGLVFHRVIPGFMIQGGGFDADGTQHNSDQIPFETHPDVRHVDGAISMASTAAKAGGTNQFFICDGAEQGLDDDYAAFGVVIEGMDVVRAIANVETATKYGMNDWPINDVIITSIIIEN